MKKKTVKYIMGLTPLGLILAALLAILFLSGCAYQNADIYASESPYNFLGGLWHGFIILFNFIGSWFNSNIVIYSSNNVGFWYDLGYVFGLSIWFGIGKAT